MGSKAVTRTWLESGPRRRLGRVQSGTRPQRTFRARRHHWLWCFHTVLGGKMRHCWIGAVALIVALATPVSFSHAQSSTDFPAPDGCVWRLASPAYGGRDFISAASRPTAPGRNGLRRFQRTHNGSCPTGRSGGDGQSRRIYDSPPRKSPLSNPGHRVASQGGRRGNGVAIAVIGAMYEAGDGVAKDDAASARSLLASANAGDWVVMFQLAVMYGAVMDCQRTKLWRATGLWRSPARQRARNVAAQPHVPARRRSAGRPGRR